MDNKIASCIYTYWACISLEWASFIFRPLLKPKYPDGQHVQIFVARWRNIGDKLGAFLRYYLTHGCTSILYL